MSDADTLAAESARIERLLDEVRDLVALPAWQRIEDVLRRLVGIYGAGLAHALEHAHAQGTGAGFDDAVVGDDFLSSLLVLHGLHPRSTRERVERAVAGLRSELGIVEDGLVVVAVEGGAVTLQAGELGGGAMAPRLAEGIVRRVIEAAAPEVTAIEIVGLPRPQPAPDLVQIRTGRAVP
jgi:hypothetical protein